MLGSRHCLGKMYLILQRNREGDPKRNASDLMYHGRSAVLRKVKIQWQKNEETKIEIPVLFDEMEVPSIPVCKPFLNALVVGCRDE